MSKFKVFFCVLIFMFSFLKSGNSDNSKTIFDFKINSIDGDELDLNFFYHKARIFIFPSLYEGFGIPLLEAMNMDCPVICSDTSCFSEIANDAAIFFDPSNIESIAFEIEKLIYDDQLLLGLKKKGKMNLSKYSWNKCSNETEQLYKKII